MGGVDIYTAMMQSRFCLASDLRDKIYALLGVCGELASLVGKPDYTLSIDEVWIRAAKACLSSSLSTNALALVTSTSGESHATIKGLPSWTPDPQNLSAAWMRRPRPTESPRSILPLSFCTERSRCLHIQGLLVDSVDTEPTASGSAQSDPITVWREWWQLSQGIDKSVASSHENKARAFWETLTANDGDSFASTDFLEWHTSILGNEGHENGKASSTTELPGAHSSKMPFPGLRFSDLVDITLVHALSLLESKTIALVPKHTHMGDKVALLSGASMPFILRQVQESEIRSSTVGDCVRRGSICYQVIGPCYVYGLSSATLEARGCTEVVII